MKRIIMSVAVVGTVATAAFAGPNEDIMARQAAMKAVGAAAKAGDFAAMNEAAVAAKAAFMVDTTGQGTAVTEARGFGAIMDEFVAKSAAGDKAVFGTCKACHADYRAKN